MHTSRQAFDGAVSRVADWDVLQFVDVVVTVVASSLTELHLNRVRDVTVAACIEVNRHTHRDSDRAWSGGCSR